MTNLLRQTTNCLGLVVILSSGFATVWGCGGQFPAAPAVPPAPAARNKEPEGCRVSGRIVSLAWRDLGGGIERSIISAWKLPELVRVEEAYGEGERFELRLPPGKYRLVCSANGTRGATFDVKTREFTVGLNQDQFEVGEVDLPISKTTGLYGKPAPELEGIAAWQDTPPLALKGLRGKIIVLDFFTYYCSICHAHKPDLVKLRDKYKKDGLIVLAIHDSSLKTLDEVNAKMTPILRGVFNGNPPLLSIAPDGTGEQSVFDAYGIYAVPAVILIDQQGRIVCRYHHAGKPDLERDVQKLLSTRYEPSP